MFGFEDYTELSKPRDLEKIFDSIEYAKWRSFRESEDSRFVTMTMPRALARLPYGEATSSRSRSSRSRKRPKDEGGAEKSMDHHDYLLDEFAPT